MSHMFSTYFLERYAKDHHADLLAEAEKARLIKEASIHLTPRQASRTRDVQFKLRNTSTSSKESKGEGIPLVSLAAMLPRWLHNRFVLR